MISKPKPVILGLHTGVQHWYLLEKNGKQSQQKYGIETQFYGLHCMKM